MNEQAFKERTRNYALRVIELVESLPPGRTANIIATQLIRAATSVGANYRAACRARSRPEFAAKMGIVEEETDECLYWLELLVQTGLVTEERTMGLMAEGNELLSMTVASIRTARGRR